MQRLLASFSTRLALVGFSLLPALSACSDSYESDDSDLTSATGVERTIRWTGFVDVPVGADDATVKSAAARQIKSAIGALREPEVGLQDRDARKALASTELRRQRLDVVDPKNPGVVLRQVDRVAYDYRDTVIVSKDDAAMTTMKIPLLFGDYVARASELRPLCSDDPTSEADSLWFHFTPSKSTCASAIAKEQSAISTAAATLGPNQISVQDEARRFLEVRGELAKAAAPPVTYPEYDRLWGFGTDRKEVVAYAFFGVDADIQNPKDNSLLEYMRFLRTVRAGLPGLSVTRTEPQAMLLDFAVGGVPVSATYEDVFRWIVDDTGFPAAVSTAAARNALKKQVIGKFAERWIDWTLPVRVKRGAESRDMTVRIRTYWGYEDGSPEYRQAARWRYLEGMWHGDVFLYQGHSHFGHGPLEPTAYSGANFPDRYQSMLINSCLSFNYYDTDFLEMHPGGSKNLDIVVNGLAAYWTKMGESSGRYLVGLLDGKNQSWGQILSSMIVKPSWAPGGYDPLRAVNGEVDNVFQPTAGKVTVTPR